MSKGKLARNTKEHYTLKDIERGYKHRELLYSYAERGDLDAVDLIADSETALKAANPTVLQVKTIELYWMRSYTLKETGDILGVSPQAVKFNIELLKVKITKVLDRWRAREEREEVLHARR